MNGIKEREIDDTNSYSFDCIWLMEKLKLNSSGIAHTSNPFNADFCALKGVFNLRQVQTESMDSLYKRFDCTLSTCKLAGCNAISFPGLEKNADHIKDAGQRMNPICIIKIADPQLFSNL